MNSIIDRRLNGKNKSIGQRERFYQRVKPQIDQAIKNAIKGRKTGDFEKGEDIRIPKKDLSQPVFGHGDGGTREIIHPGNTEHITGDQIKRPQKGGGNGKGDKGGNDIGDDDFVFHLSKDAFMKIFFDDLKLPNMVKTKLSETPDFSWQRAGFVSSGTPSNLSVVRSMRGAIGRKIAMGSASRKEMAELENRLGGMAEEYNQVAGQPDMEPVWSALFNDIAATMERKQVLQERLDRIPYLDPIDLKYRNRVKVPKPSVKALMICVMDVSGSMDEARKQRAKTFNILLNMFLTRQHENTEILFIRYHSKAALVEEEEFYHGRETGGTDVGNGLELVLDTIRKKTAEQDINVYVAHSSDGDSGNAQDNPRSQALLEKILPLVQHYFYLQVVKKEQDLWKALKVVEARHPDQFAMALAETDDQIYPVFRSLFEKDSRQAAPRAAYSPAP